MVEPMHLSDSQSHTLFVGVRPDPPASCHPVRPDLSCAIAAFDVAAMPSVKLDVLAAVEAVICSLRHIVPAAMPPQAVGI